MRSSLVTHLGGNTVLCGELGQESCFIDRKGKRFFYIDVLSCLHGRSGDDCVGVVGGSNHDSVSLVEHLVEHHAVVVVLLGLRILVEDVVGIFPVDIAQTYDVLGFHLGKVSCSAASDTDTEDVELV